MGLSRAYWRARAACNVSVSALIATLMSFGGNLGLPQMFRGSHEAFVKGAELILTVSSALLGFVIAAVALIYALTADQRFALLRGSKSFSELAAASRASMFWLLVASIFGAAFLMIDVGSFNSAVGVIIFAAIFVSSQVAVTTAVLTWVIGRLISLA